MKSVLAMLMLVGCVQEGTMITPEQKPVIRATLRVSQREGAIQGVGVLTLASRTPLTFQFDKPTVFLLLRTRHRQEPIRFAKPLTTFSWDYLPVTWVERDPGELSPLEVIAIDDHGGESRALVAWDQFNGLSAEVHCNGEQRKFGGVSVCQSYRGLTQELVFDERTTATVGRPDCVVEDVTRGAGLRWHYQIPEGLCVIRFTSVKNPQNTHRHIARGYSDAAMD